jgi:hypothetical protein
VERNGGTRGNRRGLGTRVMFGQKGQAVSIRNATRLECPTCFPSSYMDSHPHWWTRPGLGVLKTRNGGHCDLPRYIHRIVSHHIAQTTPHTASIPGRLASRSRRRPQFLNLKRAWLADLHRPDSSVPVALAFGGRLRPFSFTIARIAGRSFELSLPRIACLSRRYTLRTSQRVR